MSDPTAVLGELVRRTRGTSPGQLAPLVAECAAAVGMTDAVIYLTDYGQSRLMPVPYRGMPTRLPLGRGGHAGRPGVPDRHPAHRRARGGRRPPHPPAVAAADGGQRAARRAGGDRAGGRRGGGRARGGRVRRRGRHPAGHPLGVRGRLRAGPAGAADAAAGGDPVAAAAAHDRTGRAGVAVRAAGAVGRGRRRRVRLRAQRRPAARGALRRDGARARRHAAVHAGGGGVPQRPPRPGRPGRARTRRSTSRSPPSSAGRTSSPGCCSTWTSPPACCAGCPPGTCRRCWSGTTGR